MASLVGLPLGGEHLLSGEGKSALRLEPEEVLVLDCSEL